MKECTAQQAQEVIAKAHWPAKEYSSGKRYFQVRWVDRGRLVAQRDDTLTRGKVTASYWMADSRLLAAVLAEAGTEPGR